MIERYSHTNRVDRTSLDFAQEIAKVRAQVEAYKAAGYSADNVAAAAASMSRLLSNAKIQARLQELKTEISERTVAITSLANPG